MSQVRGQIYILKPVGKCAYAFNSLTSPCVSVSKRSAALRHCANSASDKRVPCRLFWSGENGRKRAK